MSLIIGTRFKGGILIASDPFFFDNQGIAPSKGIRFKRFLISKALSFGMAAAGSLWVFEKTKEWFSSFENSNPDDFLVPLSSKWKELNRHWINNREHQVSETGFGTLLPISNSLFILGMSNDLSCIYIGDSKGYIHKTNSFVLSGSGSDLAKQHLQASDDFFSPDNKIEQCLDLVFQCYQNASNDLFVIGFPSIIVVTSNDVIDMAESCKRTWTHCKNKYFSDLKIQVKKILH